MAQYFDGNYAAGAPIITIFGISYKCQSFTLTEDSTQVDVLDNNGEFAGGVNFLGKVSGSAELQVTTSVTTSFPQPVSASTTFGIFTFNSLTFFITKADKPRPAQGIWTVSIDFQKRVN